VLVRSLYITIIPRSGVVDKHIAKHFYPLALKCGRLPYDDTDGEGFYQSTSHGHKYVGVPIFTICFYWVEIIPFRI